MKHRGSVSSATLLSFTRRNSAGWDTTMTRTGTVTLEGCAEAERMVIRSPAPTADPPASRERRPSKRRWCQCSSKPDRRKATNALAEGRQDLIGAHGCFRRGCKCTPSCRERAGGSGADGKTDKPERTKRQRSQRMSRKPEQKCKLPQRL